LCRLLAAIETLAIRYMMNYFLLLHIFRTTSVNSRWGSLDSPASKLSKTSLRLDAFVFCVLAVERIKVKTNLVFQIFLVVVYGFMDSYKNTNVNKFRIPTTKHF